MVTLNDNGRLTISGALSDIRSEYCPKLHSLAASGHSRIALDFSALGVTNPNQMVPLVCQCQALRAAGVDFDLSLPTDDAVRRLFVNSSWAHLICPDKYDKSEFISPTHMPARSFRDSREASAIVNFLIDRLLSTLEGLSLGSFAALEWVFFEIVDNVVNHAECSSGGVVQLTTWTKPLMVELVVCDAGIGIPKSLRTTRPRLTDLEALDQSIREGITRGTGQGNGLFGSYRMAELSGGYFNIYSGMSELSYTSLAVSKRRHVSYVGHKAPKQQVQPQKSAHASSGISRHCRLLWHQSGTA